MRARQRPLVMVADVFGKSRFPVDGVERIRQQAFGFGARGATGDMARPL